MGRHIDPRERVSEGDLVRYYGYHAPAPRVEVEQPVTMRHMRRSEEFASGIGDIVIGVIGLTVGVVLLAVRGVVWVERALRRRT